MFQNAWKQYFKKIKMYISPMQNKVMDVSCFDTQDINGQL